MARKAARSPLHAVEAAPVILPTGETAQVLLIGRGADGDLILRLSNARVAEKAQLAFNFNDAIDPRLLKRALVEELRSIAIDLAGMMEPAKLKEAIKVAQARNVKTDNSEPVPEQ